MNFLYQNRIVITIILFTLSVFTARDAFACGNNCPPDDPGSLTTIIATPHQGQTQGQGQHQANQQAQTANGGSATSSVGAVTNTAGAGGGATMNDNSVSETKMRALALSFAPGAHTPSMPATGARFPKITQSATGVGFGLFSRADAETNTDVDSLYAMRELKLAQCQYLTVKQIDDGIVKKAMPEFVSASDDGYENLSPEQCAKLKAPVAKPIVFDPPAAGIKRAPRPGVGPCARPGGVRKADGLCYYQPKPCKKCAE